MITKFYSKKQLSVAAGVSRTTFYRRMLSIQPQLKQGSQSLSAIIASGNRGMDMSKTEN